MYNNEEIYEAYLRGRKAVIEEVQEMLDKYKDGDTEAFYDEVQAFVDIER